MDAKSVELDRGKGTLLMVPQNSQWSPALHQTLRRVPRAIKVCVHSLILRNLSETHVTARTVRPPCMRVLSARVRLSSLSDADTDVVCAAA